MEELPVNNIIKSLGNLFALHVKMVEQSHLKTDIIKNGDVEALKLITKDERKNIQFITSLQRELTSHAKLFLEGKGQPAGNPSLSECILNADNLEKESLIELQTQLLEAASSLKKQNDLNQQLLSQSLAFVQVSLDLLSPEMDSYNYERPDRTRPYEQEGRSLFDSNA